jgi:hypothetical protein
VINALTPLVLHVFTRAAALREELICSLTSIRHRLSVSLDASTGSLAFCDTTRSVTRIANGLENGWIRAPCRHCTSR